MSERESVTKLERIKRYSLSSMLLMIGMLHLFSGCSTTGQPGREDVKNYLNQRIMDSMDDDRIISVYFASNRKKRADRQPNCSSSFFTTDYSPLMHYGVCDIEVPADHGVGVFEAVNSSSSNSKNTFKVRQYNDFTEDEFFNQFESGKEIIVFIHGFNVPFSNAILRTAQIKYDLKYSEKTILFTWPSGAGEGLLNRFFLNSVYEDNKKNARASIPQLKSFLLNLHRKDIIVNIAAHSMGHQVLIPALEELNREGHTNLINELVFFAPDYPAQDFRNAAPVLKNLATRVTMYCSPGDNALFLSKEINNDDRAGACSLATGVDVINVNDVDQPILGIGGTGHGYYAGRFLLTDVYQLLLGIDTQKRLYIRKAPPSANANYYLRR